MTASKVVIIGAGHAGTTLAGLLRAKGFGGEVLMLSSEPGLPYQRPPLSKMLMKDDFEQPLRPAQFFEEQRISLHLGDKALSIDPAGKKVRSAALGEIEYDVLVLATGARARKLRVPGAELDGVVSLRTLSEAHHLRQQMTTARRIAIVGGGFIGLEAAAVARFAGIEVTVIEREARLLARVASEHLAAGLAEYHTRLGTTIITDSVVAGFEGRNGRVTGVALDDGRVVPSDLVLVGVGAVPREEIAVEAGLHCADGILVDESARTSDPFIFAIGDVARRPVLMVDGPRRLESIPSAAEQARQVCAAILGREIPELELPWFWSDQHQFKLKIAGIVEPGGTSILRRHSEDSFSVVHHDGSLLTAIECVNAPADFAAAKRLIAAQQRVDLSELSQSAISLRAAQLEEARSL